MKKELLEKLGMNSKEVRVYLALLELGSAGANTIARKIEENRTTTYSLLNAMTKKGLVSYNKKGSVKYFFASDPRILINSYIEGGKLLNTVLPELLALQNQYDQKPKITFYEGLEGMRQIAETLLEVPGSTRESFMGLQEEKIHPEFKEYIEKDWLKRRIELGIHFKGIVTGYVPMSESHDKNEEAHLRELKYIDPEKFPLFIHVDIFPENKVALYSYAESEMMGVIIEHEAFYKTMRTVFKLAWAGADVI